MNTSKIGNRKDMSMDHSNFDITNNKRIQDLEDQIMELEIDR